MTLSLVVTSFNDSTECLATLLSARATAGNDVELVCVDDGSTQPVRLTPEVGQCTLVKTKRRIGVGPARHLGVMRATGEYVFIVDSHCRFTSGWYELLMERIAGRQTTVHCGVCLGLGMTNRGVLNMDMNHPNAIYHGATWNLFGPDRKDSRAMQVFENVWATEKPGDDYELGAVMGACYAVPRKWYLKLNCGRFLTSYGCDEQELALKTWLAGGDCRIIKTVRIGHKFKKELGRIGNSAARFSSSIPYNATRHVIRNKLFLIHTMLPRELAEFLQSKLRRDNDFSHAVRAIESDWASVEIERERNKAMFIHDFAWFLQKFGLTIPA